MTEVQVVTVVAAVLSTHVDASGRKPRELVEAAYGLLDEAMKAQGRRNGWRDPPTKSGVESDP